MPYAIYVMPVRRLRKKPPLEKRGGKLALKIFNQKLTVII